MLFRSGGDDRHSERTDRLERGRRCAQRIDDAPRRVATRREPSPFGSFRRPARLRGRYGRPARRCLLFSSRSPLVLTPHCAVFGYLRLPPVLAPHLDDSLKSAILVTFYIVISLAVTEGLFLIWGLRGSVTELSEVAEERAPVGWKASAVGIAKELSSGFLIASRESEIALACLSGFVVSLSSYGAFER